MEDGQQDESQASTSTWKPPSSVVFTRNDVEDSVFVESGMETTYQEENLTEVQQEMQTHQNEQPTLYHRQPFRPLPSRRPNRNRPSFNFCIYALTLLIPGVAMLIVYFFLSNRGGGLGWQPSDAFVITGAVLVGFSIVATIVGTWQYCAARFNPDPQQARNRREINEPPSYDKFKKISKPSTSTDLRNGELPPSFESCFAEKDNYLAGITNVVYENNESNYDDQQPPVYSTVNQGSITH